jgi:hypothetical protein
MYVVSTFEHSKYLELAITAIQIKGIEKHKILAVPLDKRSEEVSVLDSVHFSDGISMIDVPCVLGTLFGVFGAIYGFVLKWGPILWGLIGIFIGACLGLIIKLITTKKYNNRQGGTRNTEVVVIVECKDEQLDMVKDIFWAHHALGVSRLDLDNK